jgi:hypothetical protein
MRTSTFVLAIVALLAVALIDLAAILAYAWDLV